VAERTATTSQAGGTGPRDAGHGAAAEFERLYRANVEAVTAYFARRSADPHVVADLTADTFVTAITSFGSFDPGQGTARAWVFGIARHVYAAHCEAYGQQQDRLQRLAGRRDLELAQRFRHRERAGHPGGGHPRGRRGDQRAQLVHRRGSDLAPGTERHKHARVAPRQRRPRVISGAGGGTGLVAA